MQVAEGGLGIQVLRPAPARTLHGLIEVFHSLHFELGRITKNCAANEVVKKTVYLSQTNIMFFPTFFSAQLRLEAHFGAPEAWTC